MGENTPRNQAKEPVTIRLSTDAKAKLQEIAEAEERTVSSMIDLAVREFLDRRFGVMSASAGQSKIKVRHAALPDTSVLRTFSTLAPVEWSKAQQELNLPELEFVDERPEWRRLPSDVFSGESDLVESVNWQPIFWHVKRGGSTPRFDWVGPYLQMFVGHHIFIHKDLARNHFSQDELSAFDQFRGEAKSGRDASLRSMIAWAKQRGEKSASRAQSLDALWADSIVGCQLGTDYHIAVRRLGAIIAELNGKPDDEIVVDPPVSGLDDLTRGFQEFRNGTVTAFTGNLLHSADLLTRRKHYAFLLAGPADLRVPSLNTIAGRKGLFDPGITYSAQKSDVGGSILELWCRAVGWFRDQIINADSDEMLKKMIKEQFPEFSETHDPNISISSDPMGFTATLKSLMQTWVKWFTDPDEARAFLGEGDVTAEDLVEHYEELCDLLNPSAQMTSPACDDPKQRAFWKFPTYSERAVRAQSPDNSNQNLSADAPVRKQNRSRKRT